MNRCGASASACDGRQKLWRQALLQAGPPVRRLGVCPVPVRSQLVTLQAQSGRQHLTRKALPAVRVIPGVAQDHVPLIVVRMEVEELCMPCTAHGSSLNWEHRLAPFAQFDDGKLDLCYTNRPLRSIPKAAKLDGQIKSGGKHVNDPIVTMKQTRSVVLETSAPAKLMVDGDLLGTTPLAITVREGAFRMLTPETPAPS